MEKVLNVAQFIYDEYLNETGECIDELKLQKLLYFAQRESLAITNDVLFEEPMEGWIHGPVSPLVRTYYTETEGINYPTEEISLDSKHIITNVLAEYGAIASWKLRNLSHQEISWKNSRIGLKNKERGNREINIEDIRKDAQKIRPFDYTWGMYYDEFEDAGVNE